MTVLPAARFRRLDFSILFVAAASLTACYRSDTAVDATGGAPEIQFNKKIVFAAGGNADAYKLSGWSKPEEKFTWTEGTSAQLHLRLPAANGAVLLKARLAGLVKQPELPAQTVEVYINEQKIAEWSVAQTAEFTAVLPNSLTKDGGVLTIELRMPKATSPKALGLSADPRVLGICCLDLELAKS
jgi:hypothetical protein